MPRGVYQRKLNEMPVEREEDREVDPTEEMAKVIDPSLVARTAPDLEQMRREAMEAARAEVAAEMQAMKDAAKAEEERLFPVMLKRDYWAFDHSRAYFPKSPETGEPISNRIPAGTKIPLPVAEARKLIAAGIAERADALPEI